MIKFIKINKNNKLENTCEPYLNEEHNNINLGEDNNIGEDNNNVVNEYNNFDSQTYDHSNSNSQTQDKKNEIARQNDSNIKNIYYPSQ